jgi:hypothetical protein
MNLYLYIYYYHYYTILYLPSAAAALLFTSNHKCGIASVESTASNAIDEKMTGKLI